MENKWFIFTVQLDSYVWEVQFLRYSGRGYYIDYGESFFIAEHRLSTDCPLINDNINKEVFTTSYFLKDGS